MVARLWPSDSSDIGGPGDGILRSFESNRSGRAFSSTNCHSMTDKLDDLWSRNGRTVDTFICMFSLGSFHIATAIHSIPSVIWLRRIARVFRIPRNNEQLKPAYPETSRAPSKKDKFLRGTFERRHVLVKSVWIKRDSGWMTRAGTCATRRPGPPPGIGTSSKLMTRKRWHALP